MVKNTLIKELLASPREDLVLRLTVILLLLHGAHSWTLDVPLRIACGMMLVSKGLLKNSYLWLAVSAALIMGNGYDWAWIDNHKYLITYWCMACTLAVSAKDTDVILSWNARLLLGLVFLFAFVWKLLAGEYLNGAFLHYVFLTDSRVEVPMRIIGSLEAYTLPANRLLESALKDLPNSGIDITLETSPVLQKISLVFSYWTLFVEGAIAILFMLPNRFRLTEVRDFLLIFFIGTTYFLLPVTGFAFILGLMGFAQCSKEKKFTRYIYLCLFIIIQLTRIPWQKFI